MNLNKLRDKAYQCAVAHGWHEENLSDEHFLCLVISELMEAVEADRKGKHAKVAMFKEWQGNSVPLTEETRKRRFMEDFEVHIPADTRSAFPVISVQSPVSIQCCWQS